ncbi:MAG TPA: hypothetical protein DHV96_01285 [Lachnospiraceae bacterium]|nr:hypothetical protein [Lachnospiraceae bacterium]
MANKKVYFILCVCCILCLLAACQQAPTAVLERKSKYQENNQMEETTLNYCTISELRQSSIDMLSFTPQNLNLPSNIDFSNVKEIDLLKLSFPVEMSSKKGEYSAIWDIPHPNWQNYEGALQGDTGVVYENATEKKYFFIGNNGTISYISDQSYDDMELDMPNQITDIIYPEKENNLKIACAIDGQTTTLIDQIQYVNTWLLRCPLLDNDYTYPIKTVYIRKRQNGTYYLSMQAQWQYKGISLDYFGGGIEEKDGNPYVRQMDNYINLDLTQPNQISRFNNNGMLSINASEEQTEVIDFPTAVQIVEHTLSGFQKITIADIQILYALYVDYDYTSGTKYYAASGNTVTGTPVYSFMIEYSKDNSSIGISEGNHYCYINVNMITGEVTTNINEKGFTLK